MRVKDSFIFNGWNLTTKMYRISLFHLILVVLVVINLVYAKVGTKQGDLINFVFVGQINLVLLFWQDATITNFVSKGVQGLKESIIYPPQMD